MNTNLTFYDEETGQIMLTYSGQNPEGQKAALSEYAWIEGHYDSRTTYISAEEPVTRPTQVIEIDKTELTADGVDVITISGAPADAMFTARSFETGESIGGTISDPDTFATVVPGLWKLKIEKFPYLTWEVVVNAV